MEEETLTHKLEWFATEVAASLLRMFIDSILPRCETVEDVKMAMEFAIQKIETEGFKGQVHHDLNASEDPHAVSE